MWVEVGGDGQTGPQKSLGRGIKRKKERRERREVGREGDWTDRIAAAVGLKKKIDRGDKRGRVWASLRG
jgi:hypothetical protein